MDYLKKSFSVHVGGNEAYRENHDRIFAKKAAEVKNGPCPECQGARFVQGKAHVRGGYEYTPCGSCNVQGMTP